jgi:hypothetical protein
LASLPRLEQEALLMGDIAPDGKLLGVVQRADTEAQLAGQA